MSKAFVHLQKIEGMGKKDNKMKLLSSVQTSIKNNKTQ
jgi:hypothetical protein